MYPDMQHGQAPGRRQGSGAHGIFGDSAEPSTNLRHGQAFESSRRSGSHASAEQREGPSAITSPDVHSDDDARAAWRPYVRKAEVQSMDLDAICMPLR